MLIISIIVFILALILVIYGGDMFVDSSIVIAKRFKIPTIIIGATIVSIATTLPEFIVSTISAVQGSYDLAVGNAVGSIICNTALIGGLSMAVMPSIMKEKTSSTKYLLLILSSFLLLICGFGTNTTFNISWIEALIFELLFVVYMLFNVYDAMCQMTGKRGLQALIRKKQKENEQLENLTVLPNVDTQDIGVENPGETEIKIEQEEKGKVVVKTEEKYPKMIITILFFILGAGMIALGAYALVESAKYISSAIGISEALIGLTIVAVGTSLPELITTITSIRKKNSELGYGNIIGANIINLTLLMGTSGLVSGSAGLPISFWTYAVSIPLVCALSLIFVLPLMFKNRSYKTQGIALLTLYVLYLAFLITMTLCGITV